MKYSRLIVSFFITIFIFICATPALAQESKIFTMMGWENDGSERVWAQSDFFDRMGERTGVFFGFDQYDDEAAYLAAKTEAFESGNLPDVLFKAYLTPEEEMAYLASGQLIDLAPYLEEYAPNLYRILEAREDWRNVVTQPDGAITSLPAFNGAERQCAIWINADWLDALGLSMPQTIDEYTEVLRAFRDGDPNGNGKKNDEVPLSLVGVWEAKFLLHAWGLTPNDYNIYLDDSGTVQFAPFEAEFRSFVEWLYMAGQESLIDTNAFRQTQTTRSTTMTSDEDAQFTIGGMISIAPYTLVDLDRSNSYRVLTPLTYDGKQTYRKLLSGVTRGTIAITSACDDIPTMLSWVDYLYTEEGGRLAFAGLEGADYTIEADGSWKWNSGSDYTMLTQILAKSVISGDGYTPGLEPAAFMRNTEIAMDNYVRRQTDTLEEYLVEAFPATWPIDAKREARIAELQEVLGTYVDTSIANFALGLVELNDENWAAFEDELRALGADEFIALWQAKYDEM